MDLPTRLDLFAIGRDYVVQRAARIDPLQVDVVGSDANVFVGTTSNLAYALVVQLAFSAARLMLDGAEGDDLDRYAYDRYQIQRKGASGALVTLRAFRTATGTPGSIPIGTKVATVTGVEYVTLETITFGASDTQATGVARATQAGKATQVGKNAISKFSQPSNLFDPTLQVVNDDRSAGGEDAEDDGTFRERIRDFWRTARRGTLGAIEFGATSVAGVVSAQAVEALSSIGGPARVVNLYIADSSGIANAALARAVQIQLDDFRAAGIQVIVYPSLPTIVDVVLSLTFAANVDTSSLAELVRSAIVEYINSLPVNGTLTVGGLQTVLSRYAVDGLIPLQGSLVAPTGDLVPSAGQSLRTTLTNVTLAPAVAA